MDDATHPVHQVNCVFPRLAAQCSRIRAGLSVRWAGTITHRRFGVINATTRATSHLVQGRPYCFSRVLKQSSSFVLTSLSPSTYPEGTTRGLARCGLAGLIV